MRYCRVFEHYGPSLKELAKESGKLNPETIYLLAFQMMLIVEAIHSKDLVHLNFRPMIFLTDRDFQNERTLYLCSLKHCVRHGKTPDGYRVYKYSSVSMHLFQAPTFRDDYETIYYILFNLSDPSFFMVG